MLAWSNEELERIEEAEELQISSLRRDGSLRNPVTIWVVRVDNDVYVRAHKGRTSPWFRGAMILHAAHILAGGVAKDVSLVEENDLEINDRIDEAYLAKYRHYPQYISPMLTPEARSATIRLVPR